MSVPSLFVIWELGFQPKCSPTSSSHSTGPPALRYSQVRTQDWGWDSTSPVKLWSDTVDTSMYRALLVRGVFSPWCFPCSLILRQRARMRRNWPHILRHSGRLHIDGVAED